jgi:hypothetical protein
MMNLLNEVLTASEAARLWSLDESTIKRACQQGRFERDEYRHAGRVWLVLRSAVERLYGERDTN